MATYTEAQWLEDRKELVQARADNADLRAALTDLLGLVTGSGDRSGSWGGLNPGNPYLHSEVARAEVLLAPGVCITCYSTEPEPHATNCPAPRLRIAPAVRGRGR